MNPLAAKQVTLNNALVPPEKRLKIEKCNARIKFSKPQREETYQVTLDALKLSLCYHAFLITGRLHVSSRQQRNSLSLKLIPDEMINQDIKYSKAYKNYLDFAIEKATSKKARKFKKFASPSRKLSPVLEEELAVKPKRAKKPAKKSTTVPTTCVVISDTPSNSVAKKKTPAKVVRGKGIDLLFDVALLEAAQLKKSKLETHKLHASGLSDGVGNSEDDDSNDDDSDEVTKDDDDEDGDSDADEYVRTPDNIEFTDDDEEYEELYMDVNVRLQATEHEEEGKGDEEMTDAGRDDGTQQTTYEQVRDDEHVILTTVHDIQKTNVPLKISHEETSTQTPPLLDIPITVDTQLSIRLEDSFKKSFMSYTVEFKKKAKDERKRYIDLVEKSLKDIIKDEVKSQLPQILPKEVSDYATPKILLDKIQKSKSYRDTQERKDLYDALVKSYKLDKDLFESHGTKSQPKSSSKSAQADEPLFEVADIKMPLNQGDDVGNTNDQPNIEAALRDDWFKKPERPPTPDPDWNTRKSIDFRPPQTWINNIAKAEKPPLTFDELMSTAYVMNNLKIENLTQERLIGPAFNLLKGTCRSRVELEYHFKECYKVVIDRLDWNNPEGQEYPFDLSKPVPLI
uniref:Uncharacterized protein n=1 Tax=Tanacetum cinerariifolium TaxID=118510 RepID=A0A6L2NEM8_TANCI|nr:hypothetical protein [Tanacetum cinerariifolium]